MPPVWGKLSEKSKWYLAPFLDLAQRKFALSQNEKKDETCRFYHRDT